jgi:hypothetical protein
MKRFILLFIVCFIFVGCEVYDYKQYDETYNPFFRTQWTAIDEDGTTLRNKVVIFDFDYYDTNSLTIYSPEIFTTQSYKTYRVSEITWVVDNFYYNESYCKVVFKVSGNLDNIRYANVSIYQSNNFLIKEFVIARNDKIKDINSYL